MPIYEYGCTSCGRRVEVLHAVMASGPTTCEVCGGRMRKLMSAPAIVFKGSGWAKKDARTAARSGSDAKSGGDQADSPREDPATPAKEASADGRGPSEAPKKPAPSSDAKTESSRSVTRGPADRD